ncbi:ribonuclease III [Leuconostoc mesenteroides subsp. jonggajibkimchii]|uniref:glycosyltransferase family 2 protein n=1 Tax=Leuconostoc mesenteroides TaxID=1245 RepID=UPI0009032CE5|nr:glycosyltransferase family 2 protein [Leuconostoc mesenteroides]APE76708.1 ribonuclease III [Leuconostoc mesenteroides subsp. jonggajibkimchii]
MYNKKITIVIPAYNEDEVLMNSVYRLLNVQDQILEKYEAITTTNILIIDDGSNDQTWPIIERLHNENRQIGGLQFSRNFGHQAALIAGLNEAVKTADVIVTIDADLQDDPDKIIDMMDLYFNGCDIVYGVRNNRDSDSWFKRTTAQLYYRILQSLGVELVPNHADFRLMSKRAVVTLLEYSERNLFIRGIIPKLGFNYGEVDYKRTPRLMGESKYPLKKMLALAWDGITSLTVAPVRLILILGSLACIFSVGMLSYATILSLLGLTIHGWSSLMVSMWFIGGVQMISLGVIGEYVGKIMTEVKGRPRYTIKSILE